MDKLEPDFLSVGNDLSGQMEVAAKAGLVSRNTMDRLRVLWKFSKLTPRMDEILREWQRIQQDEHDESFAFQALRGRNESELMYKKGIAEGIKWCVNRFS